MKPKKQNFKAQLNHLIDSHPLVGTYIAVALAHYHDHVKNTATFTDRSIISEQMWQDISQFIQDELS